jgi:uncharacterized Zn finger protein (UPF0148 family)
MTYKEQYRSDGLKSFVCPECGSNRFRVQGQKITCLNCDHFITGLSNKYGAKRTLANDGIKRDSKFESGQADELLLRKRAGDIKDYDSQFKVEMWAYDQNGKKAMKKTHKVDFRIHHNDGSFELLEAKGAVTADYQDRRRWLETFWLPFNPDHTYTVVKQGRR